MKKSINHDHLVPNLMGTEHELSVMFNQRKKIDVNSLYDDDEVIKANGVYEFNEMHTENFFKSVQANSLIDVATFVPSLKLLENGGVFSAIKDRPLEIATPECLNPQQLLTYSVASRLLIKKWLTDYLSENSDEVRSISLNERVVDSEGNTWGEHDNYSITPEECGMGIDPSQTPDLIWLHLITRGSITGAGRVHPNGNKFWSMSQKLGTVSRISYKSWGSSGMFGNDERLEIRCSDKNISEWAHLVRIGSMALILALARTGYSTEDIGIDMQNYSVDKISNVDDLIINKNGEVKFSYAGKISISIQRILAEAALEMLDKYDSSASAYRTIATNWLHVAEKLEKASQSDTPIDLSKFLELDWAAKFYTIQNKLKTDKELGISRDPLDYKSRAQDLMYDLVLLEAPLVNGKVYESEGTGFKLNNRVSERKIIKAKDVNNVLSEAPEHSRADQRVKFIKFLLETGCNITSFDWSRIAWEDPNDELHERFF